MGGILIELIDFDLRFYFVFKFIGDWCWEIRCLFFLEIFVLCGEWFGFGGDVIDVWFYGILMVNLKVVVESFK